MKKLTKKEFIALLPGTNFIASVHHHDLQEVLTKVNEAIEADRLPKIYHIDSIKTRSKDIVVSYSEYGKDNGTGQSYRDFYGLNKYYQKDSILIHENIQDGHTCIMINI